MIRLKLRTSKTYENIHPREFKAITDYLYADDKEALNKVFDAGTYSPGFKQLVKDILAREVKQESKKVSDTYNRNMEIYLDMRKLLDRDENLRVTSSHENRGAAELLEEKYGLSADAIKKVYHQRRKKAIADRDFKKFPVIEVLLTDDDARELEAELAENPNPLWARLHIGG